MADLGEHQFAMLLLFQRATLRHAVQALPPLRDDDVAEATAAVAATLETAGRGIIYEHRAASLPAQLLATELRRCIGELGAGQASAARVERDAAIALRRIERGARTAAAALAGDPEPAYLGVLRRVMARVAEPEATQDRDGRNQQDAARRLIIPG